MPGDLATISRSLQMAVGQHADPQTDPFCEILGPATCLKCIETINRKTAQQLQASSFPELSCSATSLVGPTLAELLTNSGMWQSRKRGHGQVETKSTRKTVKRKGILKFPGLAKEREVIVKHLKAAAWKPSSYRQKKWFTRATNGVFRVCFRVWLPDIRHTRLVYMDPNVASACVYIANLLPWRRCTA